MQLRNSLVESEKGNGVFWSHKWLWVLDNQFKAISQVERHHSPEPLAKESQGIQPGWLLGCLLFIHILVALFRSLKEKENPWFAYPIQRHLVTVRMVQVGTRYQAWP